MGIKRFKPVTPGTRYRIGSDFAELDSKKKAPEKSLVFPNKKSGGRNNSGKMTIRNVGGGHKRKYRLIDFKRNKYDVPGKVFSIEYDPNRSARIALIHYADGEKRYILAPNGLEVNQEVMAGEKAQPEVGNSLPLKNIPLGTTVHNIEMQPGKGGAIARSAGCFAQVNSRDGKYVLLKMPSGEIRLILGSCMATVGSVSNSQHNNESLGKAGRNRWIGRRPRTRGVAMNPVDHPMGGGEGKASGGHPRSRTGLLAKGLKTRNKKKKSNRLILERRKK